MTEASKWSKYQAPPPSNSCAPRSLFPISCLVSRLLCFPAYCLFSGPTPCTEIPAQTFCCELLHSSCRSSSSEVPFHLAPLSTHLPASLVLRPPHPGSSSQYPSYSFPTWLPILFLCCSYLGSWVRLHLRILLTFSSSALQDLYCFSRRSCPELTSLTSLSSAGLMENNTLNRAAAWPVQTNSCNILWAKL